MQVDLGPDKAAEGELSPHLVEAIRAQTDQTTATIRAQALAELTQGWMAQRGILLAALIDLSPGAANYIDQHTVITEELRVCDELLRDLWGDDS